MSDRQGQLKPARFRGWIADAIAIAVLVGLFFAVHDVGPALRQPYWLDEAWVAASTRLPLGDLPTATATTPLGWSLLVRLIPSGERLRLLPIGFLGASILLAYALGRTLPWPRPKVEGAIAGLGAALMVMLLPAQQVRYELKQYTADAAMALLLLVLIARVEARWCRRRLAVLAGVSVLGMLVSHTTAIVAAVGFAALVLMALARRAWRRLIETAAAGAVAAIGLGVVYLTAVRPGRTSALDAYWRPFFPSVGDLAGYSNAQLGVLQVYLGMRWPLFLALMVLGIVVIAITGRPATAIAAAGVPVAMTVLGVGEIYPLLDLRTSHFLFVLAAALGGVGIAGTAIYAVRWLSPRSTTLPAVVAAAAVLIAVGGYARANRDWLRLGAGVGPHGISTAYGHEDVRTAVSYVRTHGRPEDVILVGPLAAYGFAYYWHANAPVLADRPAFALGWGPDYPAGSGIVVVPDQTPQAIAAGVGKARQLAQQRGPTARIWLIRSHVPPGERAAWTAALQGFRTEPTPSGIEPALVVDQGATR